MRTLSRKDSILLILITLFWGINWPIMKFGVTEFPPITFRVLCMIGGLPVIWLATQLWNIPMRIPQGHLKTVAKLAVSNMLVVHLCVILGVKMLSSGRAAILCYTMPVWAALSGLLIFREHVTRMAWLGVVCALAGALLLLSSEFTALSGKPLGSLLVLIAAGSWGYGTVALKRSPLVMPTLTLTFWMIVITIMVMAAAATLFESAAWRWPHSGEWVAIAFNAIVIFGFSQVVWFQLARTLPPIASSLSVMMIPVLGVFSGTWILGETAHWQDYVSMVLILGAMSTVLFKRSVDGKKA